MGHYEGDLIKQADRPMTDRTSLGQELASLHKLVNQHDEMLDLLTAKLEPVLSSSAPHPAPPDTAINNPGQSAFRDEILTLQNRWSNQLVRLNDLINRIDT